MVLSGSIPARIWSTYEILTVSPTRIDPLSGCSSPTIILNRVVFPTPFGPMTPTIPFGGSEKLRSSISSRSPNPLDRSLTSTTRLPSRGPGGIWISSKSSLQPRPALGLPGPRRRPDPLQFLFQPPAPLRVLGALDLEPGRLGLQVGGVVPLVRVGPAAVELQDPAGHVVQEVPVVCDRDHRARVLFQVLLQPLHALGVQ